MFLEKIANKLGYSDIDYQYGAGKMMSMLMKKSLEEKVDSIHLLYQAKKGDMKEIRRSVCIGRNINFRDYDKRTALHLAANHGHLNIVKYLVAHGAVTTMKDRFGNTPLDEATNAGHQEIVDFLNNIK